MVCNGKSHRSKWRMTGATPIFRKPPNESCPLPHLITQRLTGNNMGKFNCCHTREWWHHFFWAIGPFSGADAFGMLFRSSSVKLLTVWPYVGCWAQCIHWLLLMVPDFCWPDIPSCSILQYLTKSQNRIPENWLAPVGRDHAKNRKKRQQQWGYHQQKWGRKQMEDKFRNPNLMGHGEWLVFNNYR